MHGSSFKNRHFARSRAKHSLKLNITLNSCLIRLNTILFYSYSLNTELLICQIYQLNCNSEELNPSDILPKQNRVGKLTFLLSALDLNISSPLTNK